jgi:hypothetical protein
MTEAYAAASLGLVTELSKGCQMYVSRVSPWKAKEPERRRLSEEAAEEWRRRKRAMRAIS